MEAGGCGRVLTPDEPAAGMMRFSVQCTKVSEWHPYARARGCLPHGLSLGWPRMPGPGYGCLLLCLARVPGFGSHGPCCWCWRYRTKRVRRGQRGATTPWVGLAARVACCSRRPAVLQAHPGRCEVRVSAAMCACSHVGRATLLATLVGETPEITYVWCMLSCHGMVLASQHGCACTCTAQAQHSTPCLGWSHPAPVKGKVEPHPCWPERNVHDSCGGVQRHRRGGGAEGDANKLMRTGPLGGTGPASTSIGVSRGTRPRPPPNNTFRGPSLDEQRQSVARQPAMARVLGPTAAAELPGSGQGPPGGGGGDVLLDLTLGDASSPRQRGASSLVDARPQKRLRALLHGEDGPGVPRPCAVIDLAGDSPRGGGGGERGRCRAEGCRPGFRVPCRTCSICPLVWGHCGRAQRALAASRRRPGAPRSPERPPALAPRPAQCVGRVGAAKGRGVASVTQGRLTRTRGSRFQLDPRLGLDGRRGPVPAWRGTGLGSLARLLMALGGRAARMRACAPATRHVPGCSMSTPVLLPARLCPWPAGRDGDSDQGSPMPLLDRLKRMEPPAELRAREVGGRLRHEGKGKGCGGPLWDQSWFRPAAMKHWQGSPPSCSHEWTSRRGSRSSASSCVLLSPLGCLHSRPRSRDLRARPAHGAACGPWLKKWLLCCPCPFPPPSPSLGAGALSRGHAKQAQGPGSVHRA